MGFLVPLPPGVRVVRVDSGGLTLLLTLPEEVASLLAEALEVAARVTGNGKTGACLTALCQEYLATWIPIADEQRRAAIERAERRG